MTLSSPTAPDSPMLLVPTTLQALVVSAAYRDLDVWTRFARSYPQLREFGRVTPPLLRVGERPPVGILLNWALPDGLTRGTVTGGVKDFPRIPDRWLVVRSEGGADPTVPSQPARKAWLLESTFSSGLNGDGTSLYLDAERPADPTDQEFILIGRSYDFAADPPPPGDAIDLDALGPGDPTFAAYTPGLDDVLVLHDDVGDQPPATFSYFVAGWYADPQDDPLAAWETVEELRALLAQLGWSLGDVGDERAAVAAGQRFLDALGGDTNGDVSGDAGEDADARAQIPASELYPSRILCHGFVHEVRWEGAGGKIQTGIPGVDPAAPTSRPQIVVANNAIDAMAALCSTEIPEARELLSALQYQRLPTLDGAAGLLGFDLEQHRQWFGSRQSLMLHTIRTEQRPELPVSGLTPGLGAAPPVAGAAAPTADEEAALTELNFAELALDRASRTLADARRQVYLLWWKLNRFDFAGTSPPPPPSKPELEQALRAAIATVGEQATGVDRLRADRDSLRDKLDAMLEDRPLERQETEEDPFWQPEEPVFLITNAGRGFKRGQDGRFTDDDSVACRLSGQELAALSVPFDAIIGNPPNPERIDASVIALPPLAGGERLDPVLRAGVEALLTEAFLVDTGNAGVIARLALERAFLSVTEFLEPLTAVVRRQQTAIWNPDAHRVFDRSTSAAAAGFEGTIPSRVAVKPWQAPWSPLYLDWKIRWQPSSPEPAGVLDDWVLGDVDYRWSAERPLPPPSLPEGFELEGRTFLTPSATLELEERLRGFLVGRELADPGGADGAALGDVLDAVADWDVLAQSLTGFHAALLTLDDSIHPRPDTGVVEAVGDQIGLHPRPKRLADGTSAFHPLRGGHFTLEDLWVVDDWGQVFRALDQASPIPAEFTPIRGRGLEPGCDPANLRLVELPPRLLQPSRIALDLVSTVDPSAPIDRVAEADPVAGWLLPNRLDGGLLLYDRDGTYRGQLLRAGTAAAQRVLWEPPPSDRLPIGAPPEFADPQLRAFVDGLLALDDPGVAFGELLAWIDEALDAIDPGDDVGRDDLAALLGRPLALVTATLRLQTAGTLAMDQSWSATLVPDDRGVSEVRFPIRIGAFELPADGGVGFFADGDFSTLSLPAGAPAREGTYLGRITPRLPFDPSQEVRLTLLIDPRAAVHAGTGLHPARRLDLPARFIGDALSDLEAFFRVGPLLSDPLTLRMPLPGAIRGRWTWLERADLTTLREDGDIVDADAFPILETARLRLREGRLRLTDFQGDDTP